ncbi:MAG: hypothetical protein NTW86_01145 [Candidatus Sumerlaeota bacterium]|nr:hypothetical protein [Candidatus Sumerlaeota bacterium]
MDPPFEKHDGYPYGLLPDGVFPFDEAGFEKRFVAFFPDSKTRRFIRDGFYQLRTDAAEKGIVATQWIDGSFVEGKEDPNDLDVVHFSDYDLLNQMSPQAQKLVETVLNAGDAAKGRYMTHSFLVPSCVKGHPYHMLYADGRKYWRKWFGHTRDRDQEGNPVPQFAKGFAQMSLGDPELASIIDEGKEEA